jgi:hypothetical protein
MPKRAKTKQLHWEQMCLRKRIFWTEFGATKRAEKITESGTPMRAYQCPNCLQWHLTSDVEISQTSS